MENASDLKIYIENDIYIENNMYKKTADRLFFLCVPLQGTEICRK